uniref:Uncharacterized protein n=1 Tax=Octopus bimaculoides TaxID=37653 RepID=A0A0L8G7P6_OCTBM
MPKHKCKFHDGYSNKWTFIKQGRSCFEANYGVCNCTFSIEHGWKSDIKQHIETVKHKSSVAFTSKEAGKITNFLIKKNADEESKIIATEVTMAFHIARHHQSFNSNDYECTTTNSIS